MPKDSAARVSRSIWTAAATVAALLALGGLWAFYHGGLWLAAPTIVTLCATGLLAWHVANVARRGRPQPPDRRGPAAGRGRGAARRAGGLRPQRPHRLLQQPLSGADDRGAELEPGDRQAFRRLDPRGHGARPVLPSRDGGGLLREARGVSRRAAQRALPPPRRRPLGAHPREPDRGRRPGAPRHRHHRGAQPRRTAPPAGAGGGAGRRPGGDHRRRPRLHLRQPCLRDHDRLHPGGGAGPRAAAHPLERDAATRVLRRDATRAGGRAGAGRARSSTATATATSSSRRPRWRRSATRAAAPPTTWR